MRAREREGEYVFERVERTEHVTKWLICTERKRRFVEREGSVELFFHCTKQGKRET